jgi:low-density lipoprotein receptor-related protein 1 (alpha-2-macroglobulin receptor)
VESLCDGVSDCLDGSDEGMRCQEKLCLKGGNDCSDLCRNAPDGRRCHCPQGHHLSPDLRVCVEDHACNQWGTCSQLCKKVDRRRHKCHCQKEFYLESDGFTCKSKNDASPPLLVFSTRSEIRSINLRSGIARPLISSLKNAVAIDFYHDRKEDRDFVFWVDVQDDKIFRGTLIGKTLSDVAPVVENGLASTEGMAVDWIGGNLYWIQSGLDQIEVSKLNGSFRRTLINGGLESPRALSVDPREAKMFWTDWERDAPRIESCDMSGEQMTRRVVYSVSPSSPDGVAWPNGLSLDFEAKRIYWIDARSDSVHTAFYDGADHRIVFKGSRYLSHPFAITLFESHVYWTDWRTNAVVRAGKFNGSDLRVEDKILGQPYDVKVVHPSRQPKLEDGDPKMRCHSDNGGCSHLCLLSSTAAAGFVCACPHIMKLSGSDNLTCVDNERILLLSSHNVISGIGIKDEEDDEEDSFLSDQTAIPPIPLFLQTGADEAEPVKMDFDADSKTIFWLNAGKNKQEIKR